MEIIINKSLMVPIYLQIVDSIKQQISMGELVENDNLPSVRSLARDLQISALTVKKAYDYLENEGFIKTIHGKGSYISISNPDLIYKEQNKTIKKDLKEVIQEGRLLGFNNSDLKQLFEEILKEQ